MSTDTEHPTEDQIIEQLSDYLDGALAGADKDAIGKKIEDDPEWKRVYDDLVENRKALSGLQKARAGSTFASDVTSKIHKRSAGRFFARRTLGDRVPFGALLVVAVIVLAAVGYVMWSSSTGELKVDHHSSGSGSAVVAPP